LRQRHAVERRPLPANPGGCRLTLSHGQDPLQTWDGFKGACGERRVAEEAVVGPIA
jgi:hypothetical protein